MFCGRVFIFLFQSFPLGEKGWVNQKGDFHVENITSFESQGPSSNGDASVQDEPADLMEVDEPTPPSKQLVSKSSQNGTADGDMSDLAKLYPVFWTLQQVFSNPPTIFDQKTFEDFKVGLRETIDRFRSTPNIVQARIHRANQDSPESLNDTRQDFLNIFNPKYLTSKDLFRLEVRHPHFALE